MVAATEVDLRWGDYQGPKQGTLTVTEFTHPVLRD